LRTIYVAAGDDVSCGTLAAAVIPALTRVFTSMHSAHCREVVAATREGGRG